MAERAPRLEMEQDALHGAGADSLCNLWKRPLFSEVTAAAFPSATKTLPCASSSLPAPKENKGIDLPQSAVDITLLLKEPAPAFLRMGKMGGGVTTLYPFP